MYYVQSIRGIYNNIYRIDRFIIIAYIHVRFCILSKTTYCETQILILISIKRRQGNRIIEILKKSKLMFKHRVEIIIIMYIIGIYTRLF